MRLAALAISLIAFATPALAMDGVNVDTGDTVSVDDGTDFSEGNMIALFDSDGNEMDVQVQTVKDQGGTLDIDVLDPDSGDTATIEFTK